MRQLRLADKYEWWGWFFVIPASFFIFVLLFYPMLQSFILSLQSGSGIILRFTGMKNYVRLLQDEIFIRSVGNVFIYLVFEVPVMLFIALVLSSILNSEKLKFKSLFRTLIFLPCVTALVSSAMIFRSFFSLDGIVNFGLMQMHLISEPISWLANPILAKVVIILVMLWRWTGYNTIFYLAGFQNIDTAIYEAARIDGAGSIHQFFRITLPLLKPVIVLTAIMSTNGALQLFDEVKNMTNGGPGIATITINQYIYDLCFRYSPQFGYAASVSYMVLFMVAVLSLIQLKIGDKE